VVLKLLPEHLQSIRAHAESTYPDECCGIMLGRMGDDGKTLVEVWATENAWSAETAEAYEDSEVEANKRRRYAIAPQDMLKAQREGRDRQLDIIGVYHSHTDHPAVPSECDRAWAWQQYSYIIVSVQQGQACELRSWGLDDADQFQPEEIMTLD
jgi:proteasome lid subunit RPN8/RPN11